MTYCVLSLSHMKVQPGSIGSYGLAQVGPARQRSSWYRQRYKSRFIIGICSFGYGSWEVPWSVSAIWRTMKAGGIIQSELEGLSIGRWCCESQYEFRCPGIRRANVWREDRISTPSERVNSPLLCLLVLSRPPTIWVMPTDTEEGHLLYSAQQFKC